MNGLYELEEKSLSVKTHLILKLAVAGSTNKAVLLCEAEHQQCSSRIGHDVYNFENEIKELHVQITNPILPQRLASICLTHTVPYQRHCSPTLKH